ncbi:DHA2 family efflux MFS transporter permease subunit [Micromonospora musae]|uniref:DHA2 family efflux MFS transporter permease subunit n=1 Tax=Micromonospora musae TaxID=1894970 RepID=A0A3A9YMG1_9ACTN|nr:MULTISPECIES: MFS transporter [Micromonospora]RKN13833.1 DHA2 family efflux MFS transporter permease subunit [Micromonospora musae]RKN35676.1 DHA2 family efflux MFS transporter permease subunit [Micromonospora musae]TYB98249.1 MFS transporter [Micromonospora sp. WP24]
MEIRDNTGHPRRWAILGVLVISLLVVVLDNTILNVALRTLADPVHGLGASQGQLEWAINSYTLVFAGLLFTFGVLGDRAGRKRFLLIGLVVFGLSSLASAYAQSPGQLVAARALMGIGGAAIMPATLSIISNVFDPRERGRAIGVWAGAVGLAVAIGPVLGGALLENFWWGSVFLINVPVIVVGVILVALLVPESRDPKPGRIDVFGVLLSVVGLVGLTYGIIDGGEHGFGRPLVWVAILGGVAVLAWFIAVERRSSHPSLDVRLFKVPQFAGPVAIIGLIFFAAMGVMFFGSFYLQLVRGYTPLETGLLFLPFAGAQLIFAPRSAAMVRRYGGKAVAVVGLTLTVISLAAFAFIDAKTPIWIVLIFYFIQGVGMANIMPPATESIMSSLPREKAGVGSAISNTIRQVGGALGVAVLGSVLSAVYRGDVEPALNGLPAQARDAATESISGAYAAAGELGPVAPKVLAAANDSFITAMHWAAALSALIAALGIVVAARWLPGRSASAPVREVTTTEPELAGTA